MPETCYGEHQVSDRELFERWCDGDPEAARTLVERNYDPICRFFRTKTCAQAVDDLVQQTFLRASERRFRGEGSFRAYLFGVARNVVREHYRQGRREGTEPDFNESSVRDLDAGVSTAAAGRAEQRVMLAQLQRLPLDIQLTLELFYWEGLSVAELAQVLEVPPGTVKSRLFRGRTLLREAMSETQLSPEDERSVRAQFDAWVVQMQALLPDGERIEEQGMGLSPGASRR